jgi:hypothetical protein
MKPWLHVASSSGFAHRYATYEPESRFVYPEEVSILAQFGPMFTDLPQFGWTLARFTLGLATRLLIAHDSLNFHESHESSTYAYASANA